VCVIAVRAAPIALAAGDRFMSFDCGVHCRCRIKFAVTAYSISP
jgi:hypothetical protein